MHNMCKWLRNLTTVFQKHPIFSWPCTNVLDWFLTATHHCKLVSFCSDRYIWTSLNRPSLCHLRFSVRSSTRCRSLRTRFILWTHLKHSCNAKKSCWRYSVIAQRCSSESQKSLIANRHQSVCRKGASSGLTWSGSPPLAVPQLCKWPWSSWLSLTRFSC